MKVIIVNNSKNKIKLTELQILLDTIRAYFLTKKIRNKIRLTTKNEITLVFLTESQMHKINHKFRNKNKATDILSFQSEDPQSIGELLLCTGVLKKQAKKHKHSYKREVTYMLIHGLLHLLNYDHEASKTEEKLMFKLQDDCFKNICGVKNEH